MTTETGNPRFCEILISAHMHLVLVLGVLKSIGFPVALEALMFSDLAGTDGYEVVEIFFNAFPVVARIAVANGGAGFLFPFHEVTKVTRVRGG